MNLTRIPGTGIFSLPDGVYPSNIQSVLLDGKVIPDCQYAVVQDGRAIDVYYATPTSEVSIIRK